MKNNWLTSLAIAFIALGVGRTPAEQFFIWIGLIILAEQNGRAKGVTPAA